MKLLARLTTTLVICIMTLPAFIFTTPAQADTIITLSKDSGYVGDKISISGTGFDDYVGERLYIRYQVNSEYKTMRRVLVESDGTFESGDFSIRASCKGEHGVGIDNDESGIHLSLRLSPSNQC